jgi:DNA-binding response OmpR family regulator
VTLFIYLISQDETSARTLKRCLTSAGYEAHLAWNTQTALDNAEEKQPDLFMIEHELPGVDGIQITKAIRRNPQLGSKPIMIISRNPSTVEIETSLNSGADSHVTAPYNQRVLLAQLQAIFRRTQNTSLRIR